MSRVWFKFMEMIIYDTFELFSMTMIMAVPVSIISMFRIHWNFFAATPKIFLIILDFHLNTNLGTVLRVNLRSYNIRKAEIWIWLQFKIKFIAFVIIVNTL